MIIHLTQGMVAVVDEIDYQYLNQWYWSYIDQGYAVRLLKETRKQIGMHTAIGLRIGLIGRIDHKDRDKLNNQRDNLRIATFSQNAINRPMPINNSSGYKGVSWNRRVNKWCAQIKLNQRNHHLGFFQSPIDAAIAYNRAALQWFGEFAYLNEV